MGDELRDAREATHQAGQALAELQRDHGMVQGQLESSQVRALAADRPQHCSSRHQPWCCAICAA
jgi:hypothetical protein